MTCLSRLIALPTADVRVSRQSAHEKSLELHFSPPCASKLIPPSRDLRMASELDRGSLARFCDWREISIRAPKQGHALSLVQAAGRMASRSHEAGRLEDMETFSLNGSSHVPNRYRSADEALKSPLLGCFLSPFAFAKARWAFLRAFFRSTSTLLGFGNVVSSLEDMLLRHFVSSIVSSCRGSRTFAHSMT